MSKKKKKEGVRKCAKGSWEMQRYRGGGGWGERVLYEGALVGCHNCETPAPFKRHPSPKSYFTRGYKGHAAFRAARRLQRQPRHRGRRSFLELNREWFLPCAGFFSWLFINCHNTTCVADISEGMRRWEKSKSWKTSHKNHCVVFGQSSAAVSLHFLSCRRAAALASEVPFWRNSEVDGGGPGWQSDRNSSHTPVTVRSLSFATRRRFT